MPRDRPVARIRLAHVSKELCWAKTSQANLFARMTISGNIRLPEVPLHDMLTLLLSIFGELMGQRDDVNPITEHALFLRLFLTNGGGW